MEYYCEVRIVSCVVMEADSKEEFIQQVKDAFKEENNLDLDDTEICDVQENE